MFFCSLSILLKFSYNLPNIVWESVGWTEEKRVCLFFLFIFLSFFSFFSFLVDIELLKQTFATQIDVTRKNKTANTGKQKNVNTTITKQKQIWIKNSNEGLLPSLEKSWFLSNHSQLERLKKFLK